MAFYQETNKIDMKIKRTANLNEFDCTKFTEQRSETV